jgi:DNA replication protein DnaC
MSEDNPNEMTVEKYKRLRQIRAKQVNLVPSLSEPKTAAVAIESAEVSSFFTNLREAISHPVEEIPVEKDWREVAAEQARANSISYIKSKWNAPRRQVEARNIERDGHWGALEASLRGKLGSGFLIGLIGQRGHGKTQLGVELMRYMAETQVTPSRYVSATELFMAFRATFHKESKKTEQAVLAEFRSPQLLVIDEAGKRGETDWEDRQLFELIDKRYGDMTDTLLLSNQSREEFTRAIGPSLASRMIEIGGLIETGWASFRGPQ